MISSPFCMFLNFISCFIELLFESLIFTTQLFSLMAQTVLYQDLIGSVFVLQLLRFLFFYTKEQQLFSKSTFLWLFCIRNSTGIFFLPLFFWFFKILLSQVVIIVFPLVILWLISRDLVQWQTDLRFCDKCSVYGSVWCWGKFHWSHSL